ncbi:MAG: hypothetical protein HYY25_13310 [Candidatus Wallbacteria bacterium]|nr:hypothetical protein [Candidatus Wallbacteria bacterium]
MRASLWMCAWLLLAGVDAQERPAAAGAPGEGPLVYVPYSELRRLGGAAGAGAIPISHVTSAVLEVRAGELGPARLTARFRYRHVAGVDRSSIPLFAARVALQGVIGRPAAPPVQARPIADGVTELTLPPGSSEEGELELTGFLEVEQTGESRSIVLTPPAAASCRLVLELSGGATAPSIEPSIASETDLTKAGVVRMCALVPHRTVRLSWHGGRDGPTEPHATPIRLAVVRQLDRATLSPGSLTVASRLTLEALGGAVDSVRVRIRGAGAEILSVTPGEHDWDAASGTLAVTLPSAVGAGEELAIDYRLPLPVPAPASIVLSAPVVEDTGEPREAWLALQSTEPLDVSLDASTLPSGATLATGRLPSELSGTKGGSPRVALRYRRAGLFARVMLGPWPVAGSAGLAAPVGTGLVAQTRITDGKTLSTRWRCSVAAREPCTVSVRFDEGTSVALGRWTLADQPAEGESSGPPGARRASVRLRPAAGAVTREVGLDWTAPFAPLMWFGTVSVSLPAPEFAVREASWRIAGPPGYVSFGHSGEFRGATPAPSHFPYRFAGEVAEQLIQALVWVGLPALLLAMGVLWVRRGPGGEQAFSTLAGVASVGLAVLMAVAVYFLAVPVLKGTLMTRLADPALGPMGDGLHPGGEPMAVPGGGGGAPLARPLSAELGPIRPDDGARPFVASAGPTPGPLDEAGYRIPPVGPGPGAGWEPSGGRAEGPRLPAVEPLAAGAERPPPPLASGAAQADEVTLTRGVWLLDAVTAASTATAGGHWAVSFHVLYRPMLPVLQGLTVVFGFVLFLGLALVLGGREATSSNLATAVGSFLLLWVVEAVLPPGASYGSTAFALPLAGLALYRGVRRLLDPRLRDELGRSLGGAGAFGLSSASEVQIGDLFPDSDGISFVAERASDAAPEKKD